VLLMMTINKENSGKKKNAIAFMVSGKDVSAMEEKFQSDSNRYYFQLCASV
jgi:hypothetical protein